MEELSVRTARVVCDDLLEVKRQQLSAAARELGLVAENPNDSTPANHHPTPTKPPETRLADGQVIEAA